MLYFDEVDEGEADLLDWKQQELFEKIESIRDVQAKLEALYEACGRLIPETYCKGAALKLWSSEYKLIYARCRRVTR